MLADKSSDPVERIRARLKDLTGRVSVDSECLMQELSAALEELNVALEELTAQNEALEQTRQIAESERQRYQDLFHFAPDGYLLTSKSGQIIEANDAAVTLLAVPHLIGKPLATYVEAQERELFYRLLTDMDDVSAGVRRINLSLRPRGGKPFPAAITVGAARDGKLQTTGLRWLIRDTSQEQKQQKLVAEQARRLTATNAELEQWATATAHDLREPVRVMAIYSELLQESLSGRLNEEEQTHLNFVSSASRKALSLIQDLLTYATVTGKNEPFKAVDTNEVLLEAIGLLGPALKECDGKVKASDLPTVPADRAQLAKLFSNLIHNSIKFQGSNPLVVNISATRGGDEWIFAVEDNGIGFEMEYAERIFVMFERLSRSRHDGNGVGLALCKKIVEHHCGRIWAKSSPDRGAGIYFTIPA